ncbi:hypothetical protein BV87_02010 [Sphingobium yanoikuyae]|uniref:Uncharacterized protein n=2 Tax=Sphingobium yanoikuyae TaxID=13690 RepID=A0A2D1QXF7_SPHYA|nr:hypothetical protein BV87_02010 [Sphingobium yanoikuyae]
MGWGMPHPMRSPQSKPEITPRARTLTFQQSTLSALHDIVVACGLNSPDEFTPDGLRQRISAVEMRSFDELYPFVEPGELLEGARDPRLARWWAQADATSFKRQIA